MSPFFPPHNFVNMFHQVILLSSVTSSITQFLKKKNQALQSWSTEFLVFLELPSVNKLLIFANYLFKYNFVMYVRFLKWLFNFILMKPAQAVPIKCCSFNFINYFEQSFYSSYFSLFHLSSWKTNTKCF